MLVNTLNIEIEGAAADVLLQALDLDGVAGPTGLGANLHLGTQALQLHRLDVVEIFFRHNHRNGTSVFFYGHRLSAGGVEQLAEACLGIVGGHALHGSLPTWLA